MKDKRILFIALLFMTVGIAAVTTNVILNMSTPINQSGDFDVTFTAVTEDGTSNPDLITAENQITFAADLTAIGDSKTIKYTIGNGSNNYDAKVSVSCTESNDYLTITNTYDSATNITAKGSKEGTLVVSLKKSYAGDTNLSQQVTCTLNVEAIERTTLGQTS